MKTLQSSKSVIIDADARTLWEVLTKADYTKAYMFNCEVNTDWEVGSQITWKGNFQGYDAFQKGEVLAFEPFDSLSYSTFDPNFGLEDKAENYIHVGYALKELDEKVELTVSNKTFDGDEKRMAHVEQGWAMVIPQIKEVAERIMRKADETE
ncbi:hypothetical protein FUAX_17790 [Fulvitalea axinellae]|uniref:Activator of Hsp90 ATPase homologue 1/2-like C-terminal domain-containing protein n=1 Tax=Fulvitalea axinellae TaxID=1182444 RepID=A0AAU9CQU6_9BACT|nr:hypothetical protein FUAX_17790 [Fulvitalea axinellae]